MSAAARLHVVWALLFATPEATLADPGRGRGHLLAARRHLSAAPDADLSGLAAVVELLCGRERKEDVIALTRLFLGRLTPDGARTPELSTDAVTALKNHGWPGNVRELRNVIERAMAYAPIPTTLRAEHLRIVG